MDQQNKNFHLSSMDTPTSLLSQMEQIDFHEVWMSLWLNRKLIGLFIIICLCLSFLYLSVKVPLYTTNVLIQVQQHESAFSELDKLGGGGMGPAASTSPIDVQTVLMKSRYILAPVVQKLSLDLSITPDYFPFVGAMYAAHHAQGLAKPVLGLSRFAWGGEQLQINAFLTPPSAENKLFTLVALKNNQYVLYDQSGNQILTGKVGENAKDASGQYQLNVSNLVANSGTHFFVIKKATQSIIAGLSKALEINDFAAANNINSVSGQTGVLQLSMIGPDPAYLVSVLNMIAQVTVEKDIEKKSTETTQSVNFLNAELPRVKQSLDDTEAQLNTYLAEHGMVDLTTESKLLLAELTETQKNLELTKMAKAEALQDYTPQHPFVQQLSEKEKVLQGELENLQQKASQLPTRDRSVIKLMRDVRVKSQLYLILLNRLQSLQISKAGTVSEVQILDIAHLPEGPIPVSLIQTILGSILGGFVLGALFIVARNLLHRKVSDPLAVEKKFGLSNLAIIPYSGKQHELFIRHNPKSQVVPLLAQADPKDLSIEALRSLRTSLQFAMMDARNNIITIIGVAPGIGKSFISANFAYLLADAGKKILLIDGDIRKGHLSDYFKVGKSKGLSEIICGACTFGEAKISGPHQNLDFVATGAYPPNPSELLMSANFKAFLDKVSPLYDLVIIDTAPILAVTDPAIIAHHTGANFLVLASDMHDTAEVEIALKRFSANRVRMNGMIFNFSQPQKGLYKRAHAHKYEKYQYKYESSE